MNYIYVYHMYVVFLFNHTSSLVAPLVVYYHSYTLYRADRQNYSQLLRLSRGDLLVMLQCFALLSNHTGLMMHSWSMRLGEIHDM